MTEPRRDGDRQADKLIEQGFANLGDRIKEVRVDVKGLREEIKDLPVHAEQINNINKRIDESTLHTPEACPHRQSILWLWGVITLVVVPLIGIIVYASAT